MPAMTLPFLSTAAIKRIAPGRKQHRQVHALRSVVDHDAQRHLREERRLGELHSEALEVIADMHHDLVAARRVGLADEQWIGGPPTWRNLDRFQLFPGAAFVAREIDLQAGAGGAVEDIDRMKGEARS